MSVASIAQSQVNTRSLLRQTFIWMTLGLILTAIVAWVVAQTGALVDFVAAQPVASLVSLGAWVILGLGFGALVRRIPAVLGTILFIVYSAFTGVMLSWIFASYTEATILYALVSTIGLFVILTAFALFTRLDLTRWWPHIMIGILGLIVATVLNVVFFQSQGLDLFLSYAGVALFGFSTAATVQKIEKMSRELDPSLHDRAAIIGAMMLYTNFINLFLRLLQLFGRNRSRS